MDEKKIVIEVKMKNEGGKNPVIPSPSPVPDENPPTATIKSEDNSSNALTTILLHQFLTQAKNSIKNFATYEFGKYFQLSENYMAEQDMQNALTAINKVSSFATATVGGAILGGPVGAVIGGVGWAANEGFQMYQKAEQNQIQLNQTNYETAFSRTRAGLYDNGRGTLN